MYKNLLKKIINYYPLLLNKMSIFFSPFSEATDTPIVNLLDGTKIKAE